MPRSPFAATVFGPQAQHFDFHLGQPLAASARRQPIAEILAEHALLLQLARGGPWPAAQRSRLHAVAQAVLGRLRAIPADVEGDRAGSAFLVDDAEQGLDDEL